MNVNYEYVKKAKETDKQEMTQLQLNVIFSIEQMCTLHSKQNQKTTNETKDERKHNNKADLIQFS